MKQLIPHLLVGSMSDYEALGPAILRYSILGCAKEPLHRRFARLDGSEEDGYTTRSMPSDNAEYLYAERSHALYLNMVDARDPKYFSKEMIYKGIDFIEREISDGRDVLIVCNKGESRSPSIALLYLIEHGYFDKFDYFDEIVEKFKIFYYQNYNPGLGIYVFMQRIWWDKYNKGGTDNGNKAEQENF